MLENKEQKSVSGKVWRVKNVDEYYAAQLCQYFGISDLLARLLSSRATNIQEAIDFLEPKIKNLLPDPFHLLDMDKAVDRVVKAIKNQEKICIFADYDVDGATSSALLKNVLRDLSIEAEIYVPDRISEGYGPNKTALQKIKDSATALVITVDCGAMAHEALEHAKDVGLEVIVLDHHITSDSLPEAVAVVNPNRLDEVSEYRYLAAVGVLYLFAVGLVMRLKQEGYFADNSQPNLMQYLDLVALGTVCDVMPIIGLNRAFVKQGLKVMMQRQNLGIKHLFDNAAVVEKPNCYHLGFVLGPRINAGGRVGKSSLGAHLLSTKCLETAGRLSLELEEYNQARRLIEQEILQQAIDMAMLQQNNNILFIVGENWHPGVIGIIAGRLKDKFHKSVAVIALNEGKGKASCRSVLGVDFGSKLIEAKNRELILIGGGHAMAAGFTALEEKLPELQQFLEQMIGLDLAKLPPDKIYEYDFELLSSAVNLGLIEELDKMQPYGNANPEPLCKISNLYVLKAEVVGGNHIRCLLASGKNSASRNFSSKPISAIAFNSVGSRIHEILMRDKAHNIDIIGFLKSNNWQEKTTISLHLQDVICND